MKINQAGIDLIKSFESLAKKCGEKNGETLVTTYRCPAHILTIGYGTTGSKVKEGMEITESQAEQFLREDLEKFEKAVKRLVKVKLNDNEFSALVSFTYNCGEGNLESSTALKRLNEGNKVGCVEALQWWDKGGGKVLPGLVKRRKAEGDLFLSKASS
ncbi:MAG: lysozyme [Symploca sp. SIO2C1]|nr:lysozyme [Symploca sp. SIO2C1]